MNPEKQPNTSSTPSETLKLTRRRAIIGLLAAGAVGTMAVVDRQMGGHKESQPEQGTPPQATHPNSGAETATMTETNQVATASEAEATPDSIQGLSSEELRELAESDPEKLVEAFQITKEQAATPTLFAKTYAKRLEMALLAGCTPEEAGEDPDGYATKMEDKYNLAIVKGLYGFDPTTPDEDILSSVEYQTMTAARGAVLARYQNALQHDNSDYSLAINALEPYLVNESQGRSFLQSVILKITDNYGELIPTEESYDDESTITFAIQNTGGEVLKVTIDDINTAPFDILAGKD